MIDLTDVGLGREIDAALEFRRKHTQQTRQIEERFAGNWFSTQWTTEPTPENAIFSYVAYMLPALCYSNPQVKVKPRRVYSQKEIADSMSAAFDSWLLIKDLVGELQAVCRDMLMGWGVMMVGMEDAAVGERPQRLDAANAMHPFGQHISRHKFFLDPACKKAGDARIQGHQYLVDRAALQANPRFDSTLVAGLASVNPPDEALTDQEKVLKSPNIGDRDMVELVDVWIRDGNRICTLASTSDGNGRRLVRPVQPYQGPAEGPYTVFGCYSVADDPYPMGPLQPIMEQLEEVNAHIRATSDEAASFKNITLVEAAAGDVLAALKNGLPNGVYPVKGLANNVVQVATGQIHPQRLEHINLMRDRVDRTLGLGDNQRGQLADVTASESQIVQANVDIRKEYLKSQFGKGVREVLRKAGWYMFHSPLVVMTVQKQDPWGGAQQEGTFFGGVQPGQEAISWDDFEVVITPDSMSHTDDQVAQQRWLQLIQLIPSLVQMMMTMPMVNVRWVVDQYGETWNQNNLSEILFSTQMMQAFAQDPRMFGNGQPMQVPGMAGPGMPGAPAPGPGGGGAIPQQPAAAGTRRPPNKLPGTMVGAA